MKPKTVLFVCRQNACRSQMAAGFARQWADDSAAPVRVLSAGSEPADRVNSTTVTVMNEAGVDISGEVPTLLTPELIAEADVVVVVCGEEACPNVPGAVYWGIKDPAGESLETFYEVRDLVKRLTQDLLQAM